MAASCRNGLPRLSVDRLPIPQRNPTIKLRSTARDSGPRNPTGTSMAWERAEKTRREFMYNIYNCGRSTRGTARKRVRKSLRRRKSERVFEGRIAENLLAKDLLRISFSKVHRCDYMSLSLGNFQISFCTQMYSDFVSISNHKVSTNCYIEPVAPKHV